MPRPSVAGRFIPGRTWVRLPWAFAGAKFWQSAKITCRCKNVRFFSNTSQPYPRFSRVRPPLPQIISAFAARWRVALLVVATTLVWVAHYDRWTLASWSVPTDYHGDSLEILARIRAAAEGDTIPLRPQVISRLGAPFGANWSAYPSSDLLLLWTMGQLARLIGVYAAANVALLLATVTAALAFYGCARWLRARGEWAFAGALLFAFTFQTFHRGLAHLFIVYSWTVPLALLSTAFVATSRRLEMRNRMGVFCLATAAVIGVGNPYTLFLFIQLVGWSVIGQWLGPRRRENIVVGLAMLGVAFAAFLVVESHVWLFAPDSAASSPIVRNYGGTERYALKPIELLLPPATHRWEWLAFLGHRYVRWSDWRTGEAFAPYLGVVGILGFLWLAVISLRAVLRRERLPGVALPAAWILAFASVGGITNILAFFTSVTVFRATNRFSIFISALILLFLVTRLSRFVARRPAWLSVLAAALVTTVGLIDELPRPIDQQRQDRIAQRVTADFAFGSKLERALPAGAMVFQLPVVGFPEVVPPHQLTDYEYFRPYLGTHSLKFTYGTLKGRSRGRWQRDVAELPVPEMVRQLEHYGFGAIYLNRRGFADRGEKLLADLAAAGRSEHINGIAGEQVAVLLHPEPQREIPFARSLTFGQGWHESRPGEIRWAYGPAAFSYFNPYAWPVSGEVMLTLCGVDHRQVRISVNDADRREVAIDQTQSKIHLTTTFQPGPNRIDLWSEQPAIRLSEERDQLRSFGVAATQVRLAPATLAAAGN